MCLQRRTGQAAALGTAAAPTTPSSQLGTGAAPDNLGSHQRHFESWGVQGFGLLQGIVCQNWCFTSAGPVAMVSHAK